MFNKVLVPLDGSYAGEQALRVLREWLDCGRITEAILARVERPSPEVVMDYVLPAEQVVDANERTIRDARRYLDEISRRIDWKGVAHREIALLGEPIPTLVRLAEREGVDLVLTAQQKGERAGRLQWVSGRVLRAFSVPVLELIL